jgi:hypothetical protein
VDKGKIFPRLGINYLTLNTVGLGKQGISSSNTEQENQQNGFPRIWILSETNHQVTTCIVDKLQKRLHSTEDKIKEAGKPASIYSLQVG